VNNRMKNTIQVLKQSIGVILPLAALQSCALITYSTVNAKNLYGTNGLFLRAVNPKEAIKI